MWYRSYHPKKTLEDRFWSYVVKTPGCWLWAGALTGKRVGPKYGHLKTGEKHVMAHRYSYELAKGAIPEGLQIDHLCNLSLCVNPDHLEPVTLQENIKRRSLRNNFKIVL